MRRKDELRQGVAYVPQKRGETPDCKKKENHQVQRRVIKKV